MAKSPVFLPTLLPWIRSLSQTLLIMETRHRFCLSLSGRHKFPASLQNYSEKPVPTKGHLILLLLQSLPLTTSVYLLCSWVQTLRGPSRLWVYVTSKLLSMSSVWCWVLCVHPTVDLLGWRIPSSPLNSSFRKKIQVLKILALIHTMRLLPND